ncbi:hypothetical protein [Mycobacterium hubeiense]|uniref:hypothetical protein n=1 Tax=Mycobacterium hubeiense TaxID=1867256 RepID=UPI00115AD6F0|nr:hypothetical protein [Mycobacterium sp. QGD 101]
MALGSGVTFLNTTETIAAQQEQSVEQYRRDQRIDIYSNLLKEMTNLQNASESARSRLTILRLSLPTPVEGQPRPTPAVAAQLEKIVSDWEAAYQRLDGTISDAELFTQEYVIDLAMVFRDRLVIDFYDAYGNAFAAARQPISDAAGDAASQLRVTAAAAADMAGTPSPYDMALLETAIPDLRNMYIDAAKRDLGLND